MAEKWKLEKSVRECILVEKDLSYLRTEGQRVIIKGMEDVEFYVYPVSKAENPTYAVLERDSGIMTSTVERTKKAAIESCIETIRVFGANSSKEFNQKISDIVPFQAYVVVAANLKKEGEDEDGAASTNSP